MTVQNGSRFSIYIHLYTSLTQGVLGTRCRAGLQGGIYSGLPLTRQMHSTALKPLQGRGRDRIWGIVWSKCSSSGWEMGAVLGAGSLTVFGDLPALNSWHIVLQGVMGTGFHLLAGRMALSAGKVAQGQEQGWNLWVPRAAIVSVPAGTQESRGTTRQGLKGRH